MLTHATVHSILPGLLASKFTSDAEYADRSVTAAGKYEEWFGSSGIPFFKNYTAHSFQHCLDVFQTAMDLCAPEALEVITAVDICVVLLATVAHDSGMHITEHQFLSLVQVGDTLSDLDQKSWRELWEDFLEEAQRFNERKLLDIFGDVEPVKRPPKDELSFSNRDRLLIGEFLRRSHPRLAHDLCIGLDVRLGLPSLMDAFSAEFRDLVGLVARSHGTTMRSLFPYIDDKFHRRDFQGCHIVFCMTLLRVADLLQIQPARAPVIHGKIHKLKSPLSAREWRVHQSIRNIHHSGDDPEAVYITSQPKNVEDYSRVRCWLVDLQSELDTSWATIGEVYGRYDNPTSLNKLALRLRRIRSNLVEGKADFDYVPEEFSFKVAEAEMLGLLLAPLYGDHPYYGIRELVQNARDATIERGGTTSPIRIFVDNSTEPPSVTISDLGVGMSLEVVRS